MGDAARTGSVGTELEFYGGPFDGARHWVERHARDFYLPMPVEPVIVSPREQEDLLPAIGQMRVAVYRKTAFKNGRGKVQLRMVYHDEELR